MYYIVYDDFLPPHEFGELKSYLGPNGQFPWNLSGRINDHDKENSDMYFATIVFISTVNPELQWNKRVDHRPFLFILDKLQVFCLNRVKANMYFSNSKDKPTVHASHSDADFKHNGALLYLTNCDAPTVMADGTEISSRENRLLLFDASLPHASSSPSNTQFRNTININYFGGGITPMFKHHMINPHPVISKNPEILDNMWKVENNT